MPSFQCSASAARATMSAISDASKGALKQAKTRLRRASITCSGVACGARRTIRTPGRSEPDLVEDRGVLVEVGVGRGDQDVEGPPPQLAQGVRLARATSIAWPSSSGEARSAFSRASSGAIISMRAIGDLSWEGEYSSPVVRWRRNEGRRVP